MSQDAASFSGLESPLMRSDQPPSPPTNGEDVPPPPRDELNALLHAWHDEQSKAAGAMRDRVLAATGAGIAMQAESSQPRPQVVVRAKWRNYGVLLAATFMLAAVPVMIRVMRTPAMPTPQAAVAMKGEVAQSARLGPADGRIDRSMVAEADGLRARQEAAFAMDSKSRANNRPGRASSVLDPRLQAQVRSQVSTQQLSRQQQTRLGVRVFAEKITTTLTDRAKILGFAIDTSDERAGTLDGTILPEDLDALAEVEEISRIEPREQHPAEAAAPATAPPPPPPASPSSP